MKISDEVQGSQSKSEVVAYAQVDVSSGIQVRVRLGLLEVMEV